MAEVFRSKDTIAATYFDGSFQAAVEIAKEFPGRISIEFVSGTDFLLRVRDQASFIQPHNWVYQNGSNRLEWRDTAELETKWEKWTAGPMPTKPKGRKK